MKRLFIILAAVFMTASMMAEGHMKFKDVEIDGTYDAFLTALTKHGCKTIQNAEGTSVSKGNFAGMEMAIIPQITSQTKRVYGVVASTDIQKEWGSINAQYFELRSLLSQKYGEGQYLSNMKDGYCISEDFTLRRGNVQTAILFETELGKIIMYMHRTTPRDVETGTLVIQYIDNANLEIKKQEANLDL